MRQSMTAFARAVDENGRWRVSVELKSVNHRFLEVQMKMMDALRHLEGGIRERLQATVQRGKVEVWIFVETLSDARTQRLDDIDGQLAHVHAHLPRLQEKTAAQLRERLAALRSEVDPAIAGQTLAAILSKMDVQEELDRLRFHVTEARKTLQQDGAIGRRLDFLMQEFNREANTLGSKAGDNVLSQAAVDLKVLIEQMREQVQNLV